MEHLDHQLFFWVNNGLSTPVLDYLLWTVSVLAHSVVLLVIAGLVLWRRDRQQLRHYLGWMIVALLCGALITQSIKYVLARPRPLNEFAALLEAGTVQLNVIGPRLSHRSFPSGHTQAAATVFIYMILLYPRQWYWYASGLGLVALSRVYLGVHFPSDVLAGAMIGASCAALAWRFRPRQPEP